MLPTKWSIFDSEVLSYKGNHKKMDIDGISTYNCFKAKNINLRNDTHRKQINYLYSWNV